MLIKIHDKIQNGIEKIFFKGKSTLWSKRITYILVNLFLMLVLFYLILNTILYNWTGSLYPEGTGYHLDFIFFGLDDLIPFVPEMVIFYLFLFYPMVIISMIFFAFIESEKGVALGWALVIINALSIIIYIFFPVSTYWYRQELLAHKIRGNFWADQVYNIYHTDTSFNCFPSLHASISTIIFYAWYRYYKIKPHVITKTIAIATFIIAIGVILSTLFIKQHYIIDEIAGILLAYLVGKYILFYFWEKFEKQNVG